MENAKSASSVHEVNQRAPPFGSRFLTDEEDVWSHNAWDHVPPPDDQDEKIAASLARQKASPVPELEKQKYNEKPAKHWDNFYKNNADNFFRNRKWLHNEFKELIAAAQPEAGPIKIVEIGCGAGNSVFPLLSTNQNPHLSLHAYDYSSHAVKLVQNNPLYTSPPMGTVQAAVWDLTSQDGLPPGLEPDTVDIAILVFVLSAIHPEEWCRAVKNIHAMLKPGGLVLLRDYGRHDLTQLRFKTGRLLDDNFYIRGDKTRVYFFELDELALIFTGSLPNASSPDSGAVIHIDDIIDEDSGAVDDGLPLEDIPTSGDVHIIHPPKPTLVSPSLSDPRSDPAQVHPILKTPANDCPHHPLFSIEQLGVDRRLIVNRKRQLKMYRVWMQSKFRKLSGMNK
ncbi:hypothetical protein M378DRAFT_21376 [Amanita muscaria Koide BX008]|uniref:tRNA N(3)-methylcytidine methyltransferase n=1 Tax=Amanita muscaria (strain Koide BX008) TaxID=946122 RepID=A0A0C2XJD1_AMAMK|nr:hypothetical protein M378DRAFT_21376 [Amanita muscaria Koide BX008]